MLTERFPRDQADRCVLCGLCLPSCPTYLLSGDENESPRGRIALMRALADGKIAASPKLEAHLDRCLACRACERVCPSLVPYGSLIEAGRAVLATDRHKPLLPRILGDLALRTLIEQPRNLVRFARLLRLYQRSGLQQFARAIRVLHPLGLAKLDSRLPKLAPPERWRTIYPAQGVTRAQVMLFTGCVARVADLETLRSAIFVLNRLGYEVQVPPSQGCCGALHLHAGNPERAHALMRNNLSAFTHGNQAEQENRVIVHTASGCGATLSEYQRHLPEQPAAGQFCSRLADISKFIAQSPWPADLEPQPLPQVVAVHEPCSQRNVLRDEKWSYTMLGRIPGIRLTSLGDNNLCCGGAGAYPLTQPATAEKLLARKVDHLRRLRPAFLVTANSGCALQLTVGVERERLGIPVMHPVTLLHRQLQVKS